MEKEELNTLIENADMHILKWCEENEIEITNIMGVGVFESWNNQYASFIFFPTSNDLENNQNNGNTKKIEKEYLSYLSSNNYPHSIFPVVFIFDSHQNVEENYNGSYFSRLR